MNCRGNPELVDKCYKVRGRISINNGTPGLRMWKVGTKRMLGIVPPEGEIIPMNLQKLIKWGTEIFGNYEVCPFSKEKAGYMQFVCVESASNLKVIDYSEDSENPKITYVE